MDGGARGEIERRLRDGQYQADVARATGVSRQRVGQIAKELRARNVMVSYRTPAKCGPTEAGLRIGLRIAQVKALALLGVKLDAIAVLTGYASHGGVRRILARRLR